MAGSKLGKWNIEKGLIPTLHHNELDLLNFSS